MIICKDVNKFILKGIELHVPKGVTLGVIGASGAGKTTFLKLISGLLSPGRGSIYTFRKDPVGKRREILKDIAVLFADIPVFNDELSVRDSLDEMKTIYGIEKERFTERTEYVADILGFKDILDTRVRALSLGQKRRAELGMCFIRDAGLYIFDEPCIGLDQNAKAAFYTLVKEKKQEGATILISSHDMEDISEVAERVLLLDDGEAVFYGSKDELVKKLIPMEECSIKLDGAIPDISDLEVEKLIIDNDMMKIYYNSNHVSSKEVIERICAGNMVKSLNFRRSGLGESIKISHLGRV